MTTATTWGGIVDGGPRKTLFRKKIGRYTLSASKQFVGDAYGQIGDHSWTIHVVVIRAQT